MITLTTIIDVGVGDVVNLVRVKVSISTHALQHEVVEMIVHILDHVRRVNAIGRNNIDIIHISVLDTKSYRIL